MENLETQTTYIKMSMKYTILSRTELYQKPNVNSAVYCYIPKGMLVSYNGEPEYIGGSYPWSEVMYEYKDKRFVGWIESYLIEPYTPSLQGYNIVSTERLVEPSGVANFNGMGERVVLFCSGNYNMKPEFATVASTTNKSTLPEIEDMLHEFYGYPDKFTRVQKAFTYPNGKFLFTPYKAMDYVRANRIILACSLERTFGRLSYYGVRGWIILKKVVPEARSGMVTIYNSATNCLENYSWDDLVASVGQRPQGIIVPR